MSQTIAYFRGWRFNRQSGGIEGLWPLDPEQLPFEHCRLVYDEQGRLACIEEHGRDRPLPAVKVLGYASQDSSRIVEALDYNPDGSLRLIHRYVYDEEGRMCDRVELDGEGKPRGHVASVWADGAEAEERVYSHREELTWVHQYEYDGQGRVIRERILAGGETLDGVREMDYDPAGNVIEKRWLDPAGELQSRFMHSYDDRGLILTSTLMGSDGEVRGRKTFEYDEAGNVTSET
ncbi:MAG: hypothetical protein HY319_13035 [Armatimonadetes bacterium]|nr:hypothetical protein [Armatimonadota bacterium]